MTLPPSIPVKELDVKHPDYAANVQTWSDIDLLYKDGAALKAHASHFLKRKPKELEDVYRARLSRFTSRPVLGTALGWYQAKLFADDPAVRITHGEKQIEDDPFYAGFLEDCDRAGKTFSDFGRDVFLDLLKYRSSYVLVDRSPADMVFASRAEQIASGALDVHLVRFDSTQVINWETDPYGNLEWVLIATTECVREFPGKSRHIDYWYYFDREQCALYEAERKDGNEAERAVLAQGYPRPHALSEHGRVPVRWMQVPDGLWLGNRAYLPACTYLDQLNAVDWGIFNSNLPTLWVKGYKDEPQRSEVGYIELSEDGDIGYLETSGKNFDVGLKNVDGWREEIYRCLYLQSQGRSTEATPAAQSGYSKEMDLASSTDVANGLGDILRAGLTNVLGDVAAARGDADLAFSVIGLEVPEDDTGSIERDEMFLEKRLGKTVETEVKKRLASMALKDAPQDLIDRAHGEIEALPTDEEAARAELRERVTGAFAA